MLTLPVCVVRLTRSPFDTGVAKVNGKDTMSAQARKKRARRDMVDRVTQRKSCKASGVRRGPEEKHSEAIVKLLL